MLLILTYVIVETYMYRMIMVSINKSTLTELVLCVENCLDLKTTI